MRSPRRVGPSWLALAFLYAAGCEQIIGINGDFKAQSENTGGAGGLAQGGADGTFAGGAGEGHEGANSAAGASGASGQGHGGTGGSGADGSAAGADGSTNNGVTVLVTGQKNVAAMFSDGTTLFWVTRGTEANGYNDGQVFACLVSTGCGNTPTVLASGQMQPESLTADQIDASHSNVYWANNLGNTVMLCSGRGCNQTPTMVASGQHAPLGIEIDPVESTTRNVYWANSGSGEIMRCPLSGCGASPPTAIATGQAHPTYVNAGFSYVEWLTTGADSDNDGTLVRYEKGDQPKIITLAKGLHNPTGLRLWNSQLFLVELGTKGMNYMDGIALRVDARNLYPSPEQLEIATAQPAMFGIGADVENVYWNSAGTLYSCTFNGCLGAPPVQVMSGIDVGPMYVDTNGQYVFAVQGETILRIHK